MSNDILDYVIDSIESNMSSELNKDSNQFIHRLIHNDKVSSKEFYDCVNKTCRHFSHKGYFVQIEREKVESDNDCIVIYISKVEPQ